MVKEIVGLAIAISGYGFVIWIIRFAHKERMRMVHHILQNIRSRGRRITCVG